MYFFLNTQHIVCDGIHNEHHPNGFRFETGPVFHRHTRLN